MGEVSSAEKVRTHSAEVTIVMMAGIRLLLFGEGFSVRLYIRSGDVFGVAEHANF